MTSAQAGQGRALINENGRRFNANAERTPVSPPSSLLSVPAKWDFSANLSVCFGSCYVCPGRQTFLAIGSSNHFIIVLCWYVKAL